MMIRSISLCVCLFFAGEAIGQFEEIVSNSRDSKESTVFKYTSQSEARDTFTIKVVGPRGELQSMPIKNRSLDLQEALEFELRTRYWRPGTYRMIAEGKRGVISNRRLKIEVKK